MKIKRIGVMTTGGDAPGMNAAIRAVVRSAIYRKIEVIGISRGFAGLIEGEMESLDARSVSGIINKGGTILHTVRSPEFREKKYRKIAYDHLKENNIDALVIIGGDGSLNAANTLIQDFNFPCIVIPASIDNDVPLTQMTIGYDTAVNTAVEAVDKIRDTATSHERVFIVVVMGREHGFLALEVGLVCGAEIILIPEVQYDINKVIRNIHDGHHRGKLSSIIVMAEGAGDPYKLVKAFNKESDLDVRVSVLGYIQRGGSPTAIGRMLACGAGEEAVNLLIQGKPNRMVAMVNGQIASFPIKEVLKHKKKINMRLYKLVEKLAI